MARLIPTTPMEEFEFALHRILIHVLLICDILYSARINRIIGGFAQPAILGAAAAIVIFYMVYLLARGRVLPVALGVAFAILVFNQIGVFAARAAIAYQVNVFFQFLWLMAFIPFCAWSLAGHQRYLLRWVIIYSTAYCCFYVLMSIGQLTGAIPHSILSAIISDQDERGARVFLYASVAAIAYFYWLYRLLKRVTYTSLFYFLTTALASALSLSRVYLLIILCLSVLYFLYSRTWHIALAARVIFMSVTAYIMFGFIDLSFNPFAPFATDMSGAYRAYEYDVVRHVILREPLFGFGVPPELKFTRPFLGDQDIFPSDLGAIGVWFDLGLAGFLVFLAIMWICSKPLRYLEERHGWPLFLSGSMLTAYGAISPTAMAGGATLTALIFGLAISKARPRKRSRSRREAWRNQEWKRLQRHHMPTT